MVSSHLQGTEGVRFVHFINAMLEYTFDFLGPGGCLGNWLPPRAEYTDHIVLTHLVFRTVRVNVEPMPLGMSRRIIKIQLVYHS